MALYDNPLNDGYVLRVGDVVVTQWGELPVERITVCPTPTTDPAGEESGVEVQAVELAHVPAAIDFGNGHWMYGRECTARVAVAS